MSSSSDARFRTVGAGGSLIVVAMTILGDIAASRDRARCYTYFVTEVAIREDHVRPIRPVYRATAEMLQGQIEPDA